MMSSASAAFRQYLLDNPSSSSRKDLLLAFELLSTQEQAELYYKGKGLKRSVVGMTPARVFSQPAAAVADNRSLGEKIADLAKKVSEGEAP
jgi:hypothetical protein